ncbi:pyridoxamine 5'-phosphate oxidase family protein [Rathayibacter iranicus]|uniref:General stress protein n=2 Tax=Rathayibacter iranicus TaxID=59737 RepID=A0AAD1EL58_9MICO|nr:pyridoxamine 5'-phosphate oxidase family protein [Rathayibacter iranicus]AZZ54721.1 general stress protein [Rathayibacter iranicus]MWV30511.1 general stress protein [Rathayibacter iranicus NCPPB 2253 = VKM Ac-1602]PPI50978.1 general stress protein [Rathayibacter iranicus]PPI62918.1 general stress protein [Rathayibacter iranicus]PPI74210.1 general stress protein [Rathayibacter iranicus]
MTETEIAPADSGDRAQITELVKSAKIGLLTTVNATGQLVSRPLAAQDVDFDGELWFFTQDPSPKVDDIRVNPSVNVAFESKKGYLSVAGSATVVHDRAKVDELWSPAVASWFPDGKDDPSVALIRVNAETVELWATDEPRPVVLFKVLRAAITGGQPDAGENRTVSFE